MKLNRKNLILRLGLAISVAEAIVPAQARTVTGFASFHVEQLNVNTSDDYLCLVENNGAVVNKCSGDVNLVFDLPIDNTGTHYITLQDYWGWPTGSPTFSCTAYAYNGTGPTSVGEPQPPDTVTFTGGGQTQYPYVTSPDGGEGIQLICWGVPPGTGIALINYTQ